jgi:hypothetical protein
VCLFTAQLLAYYFVQKRSTQDALEIVQRLLPASIALYPDLDAAENHLLAATEIYAQLHDITVIHRIRLGLYTRRAQPEVIQEGARRAFDIFDVPLAILTPKLAVTSADDL